MPGKNESAKTKVQGNVVTVDFGGTSASGLIDKGIYPVKVVSAEAKQSQAGNPMVVFTLEILDGDFAGRRVYLNNSLQPHALFGFRKTLESLGVKVPTSAMSIDLKKLVGASMNVQIEHDEYQGQTKAKVAEVAPLHYDESGPTDDDDAPKVKPANEKDPEMDI